ncbi:HD domain-containing protein [Ramlibacter alkalitolerans]|uniref:N-methyl-D-aspartate receptor NMDAR2C subunit n=1 Tax=Ramlibacter alkalitolerans TaxID=2039631 RepID=A0ABS1JJW1_9BURK|nr:N-methyl-D-aspartate receptor NMDAR2C subunit [Ramlibacter alkalitolerans]MBL0424512.1 N-methyl-D-aspartate receptor NMDAR2C subunit [Ramlibacter alkalitolerans]
MISNASWQRLWRELGADPVPNGLYNQLVAAYSEPHRHYHTLQHLRACLAHLQAAASLAPHPAEVELALWFHDAIYDPRCGDNEERSAQWAWRSILAAGCGEDVAQRVQALVLATRGHAESDDADTRLLLDIDLAILGAAPARFDDYEDQIRAEYAHVPGPEFRARRAQVLESFLERPRIYLTPAFHDALEHRARENLGRSLAALQG